MIEAAELRAVRAWLNESRWRLLDGFLAVNDAIKGHEVESKRRLVGVLRTANEFANSTAHEEYRAE